MIEEVMARIAKVFPLFEMEIDRDCSIGSFEYTFTNDTAEGYKPIVIISDHVDKDYLETEETFITGVIDLHIKVGYKEPFYLLYGFKGMNGGRRVLLYGAFPDFTGRY